MLPRAERIKLYGSAEAVDEADRRGAEEIATWPPLSTAQQDVIRAMFSPSAASPPRQRAATRQAA